MKQKHKIFKAAVIAAMLVLLCCVTVAFAAEAKGTPGMQMISKNSSYSPVAPDLLVQCVDKIFNEQGEEVGHGETKVSLAKFMDNLQSSLPTQTITDNDGHKFTFTDYSFTGFAEAYEKQTYHSSEKGYLEGLDYSTLFRNLDWVDQGNNQYALKIKPDGVNALIDYYNKQHEGVLEHSLLRTNEGSFAKHDCTEDSTSLNYYSSFGAKYYPATCKHDGLQMSWCTDCGKIFDEVVIPATEHDPHTITLLKETCTTPGLRVSYCANPWCDEPEECGSIDKPLVEVIPATGHHFGVEHSANTGRPYNGIHIHWSKDNYAARCQGCGMWMMNPPKQTGIIIGTGCSGCEGESSGSGSGAVMTLEQQESYNNPANWLSAPPYTLTVQPVQQETPQAPANSLNPDADETVKDNGTIVETNEEIGEIIEDTQNGTNELAGETANVTEETVAATQEENVEPAVLGFTTLASDEGDSYILKGTLTPELKTLLDDYLNGNYQETAQRYRNYTIEKAQKDGYKSGEDPEDPNGRGWLYGKDNTGNVTPQWTFYKTDENGDLVESGSSGRASLVVDVISEGYSVTWYDADTGEVIEGKDPEVRQVTLSPEQTTAKVAVTEDDKADLTVRGKTYKFVSGDKKNVLEGTAEWGKTPLALKLYFKKVDVTKYNLTINYLYKEDNSVAHAPYTETLEEGAKYDVTSPVVAGYTADRTNVKGTMPAHDVIETVYYSKDTTPTDPENPTPIPPTPVTPVTPTPPTDIDDPDTPLGPGSDDPAVDIDEPDTPLAPASDEPAEEIDEEEPPLANTPKTGDDFQLWTWIALVMTSGAGLAWLVLADRKRKNAVK